MYKRISAESGLVGVRTASKIEVEVADEKTLDRYNAILSRFSDELENERLSEFARLNTTLPSNQTTLDVAHDLCSIGQFYVLADNTVVYIEDVEVLDNGIDRLSLSRIGDLSNG